MSSIKNKIEVKVKIIMKYLRKNKEIAIKNLAWTLVIKIILSMETNKIKENLNNKHKF